MVKANILVWAVVVLLIFTADGAIDFSGSGQYYTCGSAADIDDLPTGGGLTVAVWADYDTDSGNPRFVAKGSWSTNGWLFYLPGSGYCASFIVSSSGTNPFRGSTRPTYCAANELHHYAMTWDGTITDATTIKIYYDGAETTYGLTTNGSGTYNSDAAGNLYLASQVSGGNLYNGELACVAIWDVPLTAEEIASAASQPCRVAARIRPGNLVRLFSMDTGVVGASAGTLNNLVTDDTCTVTGTPAFSEMRVGF